MTTYNASEIDRLVREYRDRGRDFARRGGTWLGAARSWIKRHCLNGERVTWGSNDVLRHDFTVNDVERLALEAATAVFDEFAAMVAALSAAKAEVERLTNALTKISAIRDSIVGCQGFNFSEHAYPLVAVLDDAGFKGAGYEIASKNLGTLIERATKAEAEVERLTKERDAFAATEYAALSEMRADEITRLSARVRELELTEEDREALEWATEMIRNGHSCSHAPGDKQQVFSVLDRLVKGGR